MKWLHHSRNNSSVRPFSRHDPICNNELITFRNKPLYLPVGISRGATTVNDVMQGNRLLSYDEFRDKFGVYARGMLDHYTIVQALGNICNNLRLSNNEQFYFGDHPTGKLGRKFFYNMLRRPGTPLCISRWKRQYNTDIRAQHWAIVNDLKETKLRSLAWRVLHNIYPTNILLFKMKLVPSQNCPSCGEIDFVEHFFYSCVQVKPLWIEIERDINVTLGVVFKIKEVDVITGAHNYKEISSIMLKKINFYIAIGRMVISKFRYGKARNIFEIYETDCHLRKLK